MLNYAKSNHCQQIHLDSGIQRLEAHQFYLHEGMEMTGYHFFFTVK
ncbi:GCN5-related N-acetyltransferase [Beggiatoa sp. PS]|nr:GCN5-related N-acetyltransferase [Beggiatoa sp. PS]